MCDRELTDVEVERAIERLVIRMREGPLPPLSEDGVLTLTEGGEEDLIIANIRRNWRDLEEEGALPRRDDLIGILRTILNSIEIWRSQSLHSQGYLRYIEGFMKKLGRLGPASDAGFQAAPRAGGGSAPPDQVGPGSRKGTRRRRRSSPTGSSRPSGRVRRGE